MQASGERVERESAIERHRERMREEKNQAFEICQLDAVPFDSFWQQTFATGAA
jgi:hypothetical protein